MRIDKQAEAGPGRGPGKSGNRFSVRTTKLRLLSLFAALVLVLIAMKEAKKPERWAWLGWSENRAKSSLTESPPGDRREIQPSVGIEWTKDDGPATASTLFTTEGTPVAERFWDQVYQSLSKNEKKRLNQSLREASKTGQGGQEPDAGFRTMIGKIERRNGDLSAELLEQISLLAPDSERKRMLNQQLVDFQEHWLEFKRAAALGAEGATLDAEQVALMQKIQATLDPVLYREVRDRTPVVRAADGPAWLRTWERIQAGARDLPEDATESRVSHIQLVSQPESYRGRWVRISGILRGVDQIQVRRNELGIDHYYVLWIEPSDTNVSPYCVYCLTLPDQLAELGQQFTTLSDAVSVEGIFLKLRSYETTEREMAVCPLILAKTFELQAPQKVVARQVWQPPGWVLITLVSLMPVVAVAIAIGVYQMTKTSQYTLSAKSEQRLAGDLERLAQDRAIKSDAERVQELYGEGLAERNASDLASGEQGQGFQGENDGC